MAAGLAIGLGLLPLAAVAGNWTIKPLIAGQEIFTDNVFLTPTNTRSDFITTLSPAISIRGDSARLTGALNYSPTAYIYALTPSLDGVRQDLFANGTAVLVPSHLFLDVSGYASETPTSPALSLFGTGPTLSPVGANFFGVGSSVSPAIPKTALTQTTSFSASPYLQQRFDGFGTAELRYNVIQTNLSGGQTTPFTPTGFGAPSSSTLTNEETASFLTGNRFGRFKSRLTFDNQELSGVGVLSHSGQDVALLDAAYAIDRRLAALATIGYENIRFEALPPIHIADAVWGFGAQLTPNPSSAITARYGHQSGITGPYLDARYAVTARTTLAATYSEALSTTVIDLEKSLALATLNPQGEAINTLTGLPPTIGNTLLGLQNVISRTKQLQGLGFLTLERDHFSVAVSRFESSVVATSISRTGVSERATQGNANWTHNVTPLLTGMVGIGYARLTFPSSITPSLGVFTAGASVSYLLPHAITGWVSYNFLDRTSAQPQFRVMSNTVLVGLSKTF